MSRFEASGPPHEPEILEALLSLCRKLLMNQGARLVFTSRESPPEPFDDVRNHLHLTRLDKPDAVALVARVMTDAGLAPPREEEENDAPPEIETLVEAVDCHARSLVLLAPRIPHIGVKKPGKPSADSCRSWIENFPTPGRNLYSRALSFPCVG